MAPQKCRKPNSHSLCALVSALSMSTFHLWHFRPPWENSSLIPFTLGCLGSLLTIIPGQVLLIHHPNCSCFILCISTADTLFWALNITVAWVDGQVSCCVKDPVEKQEWSLERRADWSYRSRNRESGKKSDTEEWFREQISQNNVHFWWQVLWAAARGKVKPLRFLKHRAVRQCTYSSVTLLFLPAAHPSNQILLFHYSFIHSFIHAFIQIKLP